MSINTYKVSISQTATFTHTNSGYASTTTQSSTGNSFSNASNSGLCYLSQQAIASGQTLNVDLASGGLKDLVGDVVNMRNVYSLQVQPSSGGVQIETYQSGGWNVGQLSTQSGYPSSGYGILVDPGAAIAWGEGWSGYSLPVSASKGNLTFRAVSGGILLSLGAYGV